MLTQLVSQQFIHVIHVQNMAFLCIFLYVHGLSAVLAAPFKFPQNDTVAYVIDFFRRALRVRPVQGRMLFQRLNTRYIQIHTVHIHMEPFDDTIIVHCIQCVCVAY